MIPLSSPLKTESSLSLLDGSSFASLILIMHVLIYKNISEDTQELPQSRSTAFQRHQKGKE